MTALFSPVRARQPGLLLPGLLFLCITFFAAQTLAQEEAVPDVLRDRLVQALETASNNQIQIVNIKSTPLDGIFEVELNTGELLYSNADGNYLFAGDMYRTTEQGLLNLSADTRQVRTQAKIAAIPESEMIIFSPDDKRASITVFTDVDCTYCRKLHGDMDSLMEHGIEVRYIAYPRGGAQAASFEKMISVWCADDRQRSLTQAKRGQNLPRRECDTPVLEHYALGNELGISGTPAIVFPDGRLIPGYVDSPTLAAMLGL